MVHPLPRMSCAVRPPPLVGVTLAFHIGVRSSVIALVERLRPSFVDRRQ
jgi:hypothetical protein